MPLRHFSERSPVVRALRAGLSRLALTLLAALLVAFALATVMTGAWLTFDGARALGDAPYAWLGVFALTLVLGLPSALLFGLLVTPLAALTRRLHPRWGLLTCAAGGGALVWITTSGRFAVLGVLGGLAYAALEGRFRRRRREMDPPGE